MQNGCIFARTTYDLLPEGMSRNVRIYSFHSNFYTSRDEFFQNKSFEIRHKKLQERDNDEDEEDFARF